MRAQICRILQLLEAAGSGNKRPAVPPDEPDSRHSLASSSPQPRKTSRVSLFSGLSGSLFGGLDDMEEDVGGEEAADDMEGLTLGQLISRRRMSSLGRIVEAGR